MRIPAVRGRLRNWHTFFPFVVELGYYNIVDKFHPKMSLKKTQLIEWLDKHLDDCPFDWYEGVNDGEIIFILEEKN